MCIRWLENSDIDEVKQVWKACFEDTDEFVNTYFRICARVENGLGYFETGELMSDLFMLDFWINLSGTEYTAPFLAGCATMPKARKRGLMRDLIKEALNVMYDNGTEISYLHPFKHSFYRQFGYETVAFVQKKEEAVHDGYSEHDVVITNDIDILQLEKLSRAYMGYVDKFDSYFRRTLDKMRAWLTLLFADGGKIAYVEVAGSVSYALYYENNGIADIFELVFSDIRHKRSILNSIGMDKCKYFVPIANAGAAGGATEHTMLRVVNPLRVLKKQMFENDMDFVISIEDSFLEKSYNLSVKVKKGMTEVSSVDGTADFHTDIASFAKLVSGAYGNEYPRWLSDVFPRRTSCYFETY